MLLLIKFHIFTVRLILPSFQQQYLRAATRKITIQINSSYCDTLVSGRCRQLNSKIECIRTTPSGNLLKEILSIPIYLNKIIAQRKLRLPVKEQMDRVIFILQNDSFPNMFERSFSLSNESIEEIIPRISSGKSVQIQLWIQHKNIEYSIRLSSVVFKTTISTTVAIICFVSTQMLKHGSNRIIKSKQSLWLYE